MTKRVVVAGLVGGLLLFLWESVAHMALPLGDAGIKALQNEKQVIAALQENVKEDGFYLFPAPEDRPGMTSAEKSKAMENSFEASRTGANGIMIVQPHGRQFTLSGLLATQFGTDVVAMLLVAALAARSRLDGYKARLWFIALLGFLPTLRTEIPYWNWYSFPTAYTAALAVVHLVGFVVAGLAMAKLLGGESSQVKH